MKKNSVNVEQKLSKEIGENPSFSFSLFLCLSLSLGMALAVLERWLLQRTMVSVEWVWLTMPELEVSAEIRDVEYTRLHELIYCFCTRN